MPLFSPAELASMQATQTLHMQDEGVVYTHAPATVDDFNLPVAAYTAARCSTACGFKPTAKETANSGEVPMVDAKLRLPIATVIGAHDLFLLTKRYGVVLTDTNLINGESVTGQLYTVFGPPERGPSGLVVNLKLATE